jgi:hypothetical protein
MKWKVQFFAVGLIVAVMAISSAGAGGRQQFPFAGGRVTAVDKKTITVEGFTGSRKINVTDKTKFTKSVDGKLSDVKKGAKVSVRGKMSGDGKTIEAETIILNPPPPMRRGGGRPAGAPGAPVPASPGGAPGGAPGGGRSGGFGGRTPPTRGEVTNVSPLTVKTEDGKSVTVKTTAQTKVSVTKSASLSDVKKDEFIMAFGKQGANGSIDAEAVRIGGGFGRFGGGGPGGGRPGGAGR